MGMIRHKKFFIILLAGAVLFLMMVGNQSHSNQQFSLTSSAFSHNSAIPKKYTCLGANLSTPLEWSGVPAGTKSLALIMDDPDAERVVGYTWVHWVVYNIPPSCRRLPEGLRALEKLPLGNGTFATQGITSWKKPGYGGPCPPAGTGVHHYNYRLLALSFGPELPAGLTKASLLEKVKGHIIAEARLTGTYERK